MVFGPCGQALPFESGRQEDDMSDLRIYDVILETIAMLRPIIEAIERRDPDLGRQARRAAASVALNVSEGSYSRGRNKQLRYHSALGSAREVWSCVEVAMVLGYVGRVSEKLAGNITRILGTLTKLAR
jgi:four helix bundle protein